MSILAREVVAHAHLRRADSLGERVEYRQRGSDTNHLQHAGTDTVDWHAGVISGMRNSAFKPAAVRRHGRQSGTLVRNRTPHFLQCIEHDAAIRTPIAAKEDQNEGALSEEIIQRDEQPLGIREHEVREPVPCPERMVEEVFRRSSTIIAS